MDTIINDDGQIDDGPIEGRQIQGPESSVSLPQDVSLLVFSDDWGRHPSSCQHLIRHLLPRIPTAWVNTIGMRTPTFDLATIRRAAEKLRHWSGAGSATLTSLPENLSVWNPRMWPAFSGPASRRLNRFLLNTQLKRRLGNHDGQRVAVTTVPIVADLMGRLPVDRWVYYCVDDFSHWPGLDQKTMAQLEEKVIAKSDCLIAAGETLQQRLRESGKPVHLLTHGVDVEHWSSPTASGSRTVWPWQTFERPLIVFWGVIDQRMDVEFLRQLSNDLDRGTILLVGPQADPDPTVQGLPRLRILPPMDYQDLPALGNDADVLVMPYADLPVTQAMQPLKLLEYLANQKPVVVRDLPATRQWSDCLDIASDPIQFSHGVLQGIKGGLSEAHRKARGRVQDESWTARASEFERLLFDRGQTGIDRT